MGIPGTFITVNYSSIVEGTEIPIETETGINILFDKDEIDIQRLLQYVSRLQYNYIYSFSASLLNSNNIPSLLPGLYMLFTLSAGFRTGNNRISVFALASNEQSLTLQSIKDYFAFQGEPIDFISFDLHTPQIQKDTLLLNWSQLKNLDKKQTADYYTRKVSRLIIFDNTVNASIETGAIKALLQENPLAYLLFEMVALQNNQNWSLHQSELWQNRASLYLSFIALGKKVGEQEYYDIKNWYHTEYEVLPLWFKRLGHIVKVVIGKRSFKSLFADKIKKK